MSLAKESETENVRALDSRDGLFRQSPRHGKVLWRWFSWFSFVKICNLWATVIPFSCQMLRKWLLPARRIYPVNRELEGKSCHGVDCAPELFGMLVGLEIIS